MRYQRWVYFIVVACLALLSAATRALGDVPSLGEADDTAGFSTMLTPTTDGTNYFKGLGATGDSQAILECVVKIEKLWPNDTMDYCKNYMDLLTAILRRGFKPLDLQAIEATVNPVLARKEEGGPIVESPGFATVQAVAIRLLLKTAWNEAPPREILRITDRSFGFMEGWRREIRPEYDRLRTGHSDFRPDDIKDVHTMQRTSERNWELLWRQEVRKMEIAEISKITLKLLNNAGMQNPELDETTKPLAERAEALGRGLFDNQASR